MALTRYRTEIPDEPELRGGVPGGVLWGALLGGLGGLLVAGIEAGVSGRAGLSLPQGELGEQVLALYAGTGVVCGVLAGLTGYRGARHAVVAIALWLAWMVSGKLGMVLAEGGTPGWLGAVVTLPLAMVIAVAAAHAIRPPAVVAWLGTVALVASAVALPLNLHLLGHPLSRPALFVDFIALLVGVIAAGVVAALAGRGGSGRMALLGLAGTGVAWLLAWPVLTDEQRTFPVAERAELPPVVLVVIDTVRADHLGTYGYGRPTTPHLDARAARGVVYEQAHATSSWTLPSVASMFTGRMPSDHGAGVNTGQGNLRTAIRPDVDTLPRQLTRHGYLSAAVLTNPYLSRAYGFHRGFAHFDDRVGPAAFPTALHPWRVIGVKPVTWPAYRTADEITDEALAFVEAQPAGGWFLMVHYMDPHGPFYTLAEDREALGASSDPLIDHYDAALRRVDRNLERLLSALPPDAWVVITSDHGEEFGEQRTAPRGVPRGSRHGHTLYQEQLHVPLVVLGPGLRPQRVARPVSLTDLAPTLLAAVGAEIPRRMTGRPLHEVVGGEASEPRPVMAEAVRWGTEQQAVRDGHLKLITRGSGARLFDLAGDPGERRPLNTSQGEPRQQATRLRALLPPVGAANLGEPVSLGDEMRELLERLGYVD